MTRRPVDIQRLRHVHRELLRSRDFRDQAAASDQFRWWHNRALHNAFGVASGMSVALATDAESALVQPGAAYDRIGRELLVLAPRSVRLPSQQQPMTLVARYRAGSSPGRPGINGAEAALVWQRSGQAGGEPCGPGQGVPLAQLTYVADVPTLTVVSSPARPLARPRIGNGSTPADSTPWRLWLYQAPDEPVVVLGLEVTVDTSAAGFTEVPCYFAWLQWPRVADSRLPYPLYLALGFQYVDEPATDRFLFRVLLPLRVVAALGAVLGQPRPEAFLLSGGRGHDDTLGVARSLGLSLCWLGIQHEDSTEDGQEL
jgi:hypothetical protein